MDSYCSTEAQLHSQIFCVFFPFFCSKTAETDESVDTAEKKEETKTAGTNTGDVSR